ncbi:MAG: ribose-phosphate pyrophosphokinase [Gammaproteobacteria bacterium]|jgi:ribose-phosphate pyrophosphokinase
MDSDTLRLFALSESRDLGEGIAAALDLTLSRHEERDFEDGEHKIRPLESVRNNDVFVVQSLYTDTRLSVNDKLCRLLFFLGALRDAGASRLTAVLPYLCYARKDIRTKSRDPVTTRYVAQLLEAVGLDGVVVLDVHNRAAFQNAFRCRTDHLRAQTLFAEHFVELVRDRPVTVVSPDTGGAKRAEAFRQTLSLRLGREAGNAFLEKYRSAGEVTGSAVVGDIDGSVAIILDDLVSTGGTLARAAHACTERGAIRVYAAASHGIFVGEADEVLAESGLERLIITNTIPPFRLHADTLRDKVTVLDAAPLLAAAVRHIHTGEPGPDSTPSSP